MPTEELTEIEVLPLEKVKVDFSKVKIHCSSLGVLFTEPKSKADKDAGNLSETAKSHLIKVYAREYWGRERKIETKQMAKGTIQENIGIDLLGEIDGNEYKKNTIMFDNDWLVGTPDIIHVPSLCVIDLKLSWDAETFLPNIVAPLDKMYYCQLQGYLFLTGMDNGKVGYGLVDATAKQILDEQRKIFYQMDCATEENPEYLLACAEVEKNMTYADIPKHERVVYKTANRDDELIEQIPAKVQRAREFLSEFHKLHTKGKYILTK
jgi:hypothetical protein